MHPAYCASAHVDCIIAPPQACDPTPHMRASHTGVLVTAHFATLSQQYGQALQLFYHHTCVLRRRPLSSARREWACLHACTAVPCATCARPPSVISATCNALRRAGDTPIRARSACPSDSSTRPSTWCGEKAPMTSLQPTCASQACTCSGRHVLGPGVM